MAGKRGSLGCQRGEIREYTTKLRSGNARLPWPLESGQRRARGLQAASARGGGSWPVRAAPRGSLEASGRQGTGAGGHSLASLSDPRRDHQFSRRRHGPRRAPSSESLAKRDAAARPRRPSNQAQREALRSCLKGPLSTRPCGSLSCSSMVS